MTSLAVSKEHLAGVSGRAIAYLIDFGCALLMFAMSQYLIFVPLRSAVGITDDWFRSGWNTELYTLLTISLPVWLYFAILESSPWRATIGKRMVGIEVVDSSSRSIIGFPRSFLRTAIKLIPWELAHLGNTLPEPIWYAEQPEFRVFFAISGLLMSGYILVMCTTARRQGVHDMVAGTLVVKRESTTG